MNALLHDRVIPVILSGGSGTRLWPVSRALHPKQFFALHGDQTLFQQAATRLLALADTHIRMGSLCVVANDAHRYTVVDQLREIGVQTANILLEPEGRNTAPALTLAALEAAQDGTDPILVVGPADHAIADVPAFVSTLREAIAAAADGSLVVLGIQPDEPHTGYGYIRTHSSPQNGPATVDAFVEKPDAATAQRYIDDGGYAWNSGMFVLRCSTWLGALRRFRPDIAQAVEVAWEARTTDGEFKRFSAGAFAAIPSESIDYAVMEPASRPSTGIAVRMSWLKAGWSDLGAWDAVWQSGKRDSVGNGVHGDAHVIDSRNTLVHSTSRLVGVIGLDDVTVVETADAVLVAHRSKSAQVKNLVGALTAAGRSETNVHRRVHRPWGWYENIDQGTRFQVKRIMVKPGAKLSLQMHHHRAEHWVVVSGTAEVTNGTAVTLLSENESTFIPLGQTHRLANPGRLPLEIIEVQSGSYLSEDDIVRFEDHYGRA